MLKIDIIAIGRLKKGPLHELFTDYKKKTRWNIILHEIESRHRDEDAMQKDENEKLSSLIAPGAYVIAMDERGKTLKSLEFAEKFETLQNNAQNDIRTRANLLLSFGKQTWPHMLARIMLIEQIYRAQQILAGHPYHRE